MLNFLRRLIPKKIFSFFQPAYHTSLTALATIIYRFPSKRLVVVGITGTKGKSTTAEMLTDILRADSKTVFLSSTIHFVIAGEERANLLKMTMPGRFLLQKLMREAVNRGCTHAVVEMSSEGAKLWRHVGIQLNGLVVTNLSLEHIESHGSFANYRAAKLRLARALVKSPKPDKFLILNKNDEALALFKETAAGKKIKVSEFNHLEARYQTTLPGQFNLENALAAGAAAEELGVPTSVIASALAKFSGAKGRLETIKVNDQQNFSVIIDYAHTADSLEKLYQAYPNQTKICVLGGTGGGRDRAKRDVMGNLAERYCREIILTNEDPYDEDPMQIIDDVAKGIKNKTPQIILDRRQAIAQAIKQAQAGEVVIISGKGTDPYIMGPNGTKQPWSDASVAREELESLLSPISYKL